MVDEDKISLSAEFSLKVIQIQSPDEGPTKPVLLQVSDLDSTTTITTLMWHFHPL